MGRLSRPYSKRFADYKPKCSRRLLSALFAKKIKLVFFWRLIQDLQIIVTQDTQIAICGYNENRKSMGVDPFRVTPK